MSSAESKTESALAVFALKDQNAKLSEENAKLVGELVNRCRAHCKHYTIIM